MTSNRCPFEWKDETIEVHKEKHDIDVLRHLSKDTVEKGTLDFTHTPLPTKEGILKARREHRANEVERLRESSGGAQRLDGIKFWNMMRKEVEDQGPRENPLFSNLKNV